MDTENFKNEKSTKWNATIEVEELILTSLNKEFRTYIKSEKLLSKVLY